MNRRLNGVKRRFHDAMIEAYSSSKQERYALAWAEFGMAVAQFLRGRRLIKLGRTEWLQAPKSVACWSRFADT
jgi:hypothetical protein